MCQLIPDINKTIKYLIKFFSIIPQNAIVGDQQSFSLNALLKEIVVIIFLIDNKLRLYSGLNGLSI